MISAMCCLMLLLQPPGLPGMRGGRVPSADPDGPQVVCQDGTHEIGPYRSGAPYEYSIPIENRGRNRLELTNLTKSPGLTEVRFPAELVPGEKGELVVLGRVLVPRLTPESFQIRTNDRANLSMQFELRVDGVRHVYFQPRVVHLVKETGGQEYDVRVDLCAVDAREPFRIHRVRMALGRLTLALTEPLPVEAATRHTLHLRLGLLGDGLPRDMVVVEVDHPLMPIAELFVVTLDRPLPSGHPYGGGTAPENADQRPDAIPPPPASAE